MKKNLSRMAVSGLLLGLIAALARQASAQQVSAKQSALKYYEGATLKFLTLDQIKDGNMQPKKLGAILAEVAASRPKGRDCADDKDCAIKWVGANEAVATGFAAALLPKKDDGDQASEVSVLVKGDETPAGSVAEAARGISRQVAAQNKASMLKALAHKLDRAKTAAGVSARAVNN